MTVYQVLRALWQSPGELLLRRWNWKSAVFSSTLRATIFFLCNLKAGWSAATGAMLAEFIYRSVTAGFYGALTQSFRRVTPIWAANVAVMVLLPLASHSLELGVHLLRHTPKLKTSIITSVVFTIISTLFNLYAMRRGALIVGEDAQSAAADMRRMPRLIGGFIAAGPLALYRFCTRTLTPARITASLLLLLILGNRSSFAATNSKPVEKHVTRIYRATAVVTLLSVPLLSRTGVGGGFASLEENTVGAEHEMRLRFLSGSSPERAAGLNRLGYIEESLTESPSHEPAVHYFGFITANREESLAQAKNALGAKSGAESEFVAAQGQFTPDTSAFSVRNLQIPSHLRWNQSDALLQQVTEQFGKATPTRAEHHTATQADRYTKTFLLALMQAISTSQSQSAAPFVHNGKRFLLTTRKSADIKEAADFERLRFGKTDGIIRLNGTIHSEDTGKETTFRLWFDRLSSNPLPLRFELHPRSYLKLVFDAVPDTQVNEPAGEQLTALPSRPTSNSFAGN